MIFWIFYRYPSELNNPTLGWCVLFLGKESVYIDDIWNRHLGPLLLSFSNCSLIYQNLKPIQ